MSHDLVAGPRAEDDDLPEAWREHLRQMRQARQEKEGRLGEKDFEPLIAEI